MVNKMNVAAAGHDSRAVANAIIQTARAKGINLTIMQLVKLIYYAQGWCLAFLDRPLTRDEAEAWQYGPVYPAVYKAYPNYRSNIIDRPIWMYGTKTPIDSNFTEEDLSLLDWVVDEYGKIHAFDLSTMTHSDGSPWKETVDKHGFYAEIPASLMKRYFKQFVAEPELDVTAN